MHSISSLPAFHTAQKFDWNSFRCVLDVGGGMLCCISSCLHLGSGIYSISIVKQHPHMKAIVYDIEKVLTVCYSSVQSTFAKFLGYSGLHRVVQC